MPVKIIIAFFLLSATNADAQTVNDSNGVIMQFPQLRDSTSKSLRYSIINSGKNTYGYDIFSGKKLLIHQTNKPGLPGNEGFTSEEDARKVAELVIQKIEGGQMPPAVSMSELKILGVVE